MADCSGPFTDDRASRASAAIVLPLLIDIFRPRSLIEIGSSGGAWSKAALALGVDDLVGVVNPQKRPAPAAASDRLRRCDLTAPFDLGRHFDLALSMDFGEHVAAAQADAFVGNIVRHSDAVVFSAAAPQRSGRSAGQGPSYWAAKFAARHYRCFDVLRWRVRHDRRVATRYRDNLLVFANRRNAALIHRLERQAAEALRAGSAAMHPEAMSAMNSCGARLQRLLALLGGVRALAPKREGASNAQAPGRL